MTRATGWSLLLAGLALSALANARRWRRDRVDLARILAAPAPPPPDQWPTTPTVSLLVAAWNEAAHIEAFIDSALALRYPRLELVLCAGGDDDTLALARRREGDRVLVIGQRPGEGKQGALARALPRATGEVVFFTDADCLLEDGPFERTLYPVAVGLAEACSGRSRPLPSQQANPFVLSQAAAQLYGALQAPDQGADLQGSNAAATRALLVRTGALAVPARAGTDYALARALTAGGCAIRQEPASLMATRFPTGWRAYARQQRRWLRTLAWQGRRFGAAGDVRAALRSGLVGLVMLLWPLPALAAGPLLLVPWLWLVGHAWLSRLRYVRLAGVALGVRPGPRAALLQGPLLLLDFAAWAGAVLELVWPARREAW